MIDVRDKIALLRRLDEYKAQRDSLRSHADALAAAISQYLEARLKPDQTALSVTGLCGALNDYLDFTGEPNKERNLTASRGRNE